MNAKLSSPTFSSTRILFWTPSKDCRLLYMLCYATVFLVTVVGITSAVDPDFQVSTVGAQQTSATGTNADLLSYKMFSDDAGADQGSTDQRKRPPNEFDEQQQSNLSGSRVQRHISHQERRSRRQRKNHHHQGRRRHGTGSRSASQHQYPPLRPLPAENDTVSVVAFKELKPSVSVTIGKPPRQMFTGHGRGFCKAVPFSQLVNVTGCQPVYITNHYCYGACNSFYIPSENHIKFPPFTSVQGCIPKRFSTKLVKLTCGGGGGGGYDQISSDGEDDNRIVRDSSGAIGGAVTIRKLKVKVVTKCKCSKIDVKI